MRCLLLFSSLLILAAAPGSSLGQMPFYIFPLEDSPSDSQPPVELPAVEPPPVVQAAETPVPLEESLSCELEAACCDPCNLPADSARFEKAAAAAYKGLYYNNEFSYLEDPAYEGWHLGERAKRIRPLPCWVVDAGGEYRIRFHHETNLRAKPLSGVSDDFILHRTRLYANAQYSDNIRLYVEGIDAASDANDVLPRSIEVNRFDALNMFVDLRALDNLILRGGRQELLYGSQRLVSPLDWSNTRRTFDGAKFIHTHENWSLDGWWSRPVPFAQHIAGGRPDHNFDHPDSDEQFIGLWSTYTAAPGKTADFYFLRSENSSGGWVNANGQAGAGDFNLFATRLAGGCGPWQYEVEGGYQFGDFAGADVSAGFATAGIGRTFAELPGAPSLWVYYDWASGDDNPADQVHGTFFQYFPLGHKYLGFMDIVGRQNIGDFNILGTVSLHENVKLICWYHIFRLQSSTDALYNVAGAPIYQDPTGGSGNNIGQELDVALSWTITPRMDILFGYSYFWAGSYFDSPVIQTPGVPAGGIANNGANGQDADFFYTQWSLRF